MVTVKSYSVKMSERGPHLNFKVDGLPLEISIRLPREIEQVFEQEFSSTVTIFENGSAVSFEDYVSLDLRRNIVFSRLMNLRLPRHQPLDLLFDCILNRVGTELTASS